jgi:hypothetical protein
LTRGIDAAAVKAVHDKWFVPVKVVKEKVVAPYPHMQE